MNICGNEKTGQSGYYYWQECKSFMTCMYMYIHVTIINILPVEGVKGTSWLDTVSWFDCVQGTAVDYMHCVLLGVTRQLLHLWFDSKHHHALCYTGARITEIDSHLLAIKPPSEMKRTP